MSNIADLLFIWLIGLALGYIFFAGLWWTVKKSLHSSNPASWLLISMLVRMAVTITGFYLVVTYVGNNEVGSSEMVNTSWLRLLTCLLGFICARLVISKVISRVVSKETTKVDRQVNRVIATDNIHSSEGS